MHKISEEEFRIILEKSYQTNVSKSIRRIFFNSISEEEKQKGRWHIGIMSGKGTCIIIKYDHRFFAISANHVFRDLKDKEGNYLNASPFWIPMEFHTKWEKMDDFFMPKKFWEIGKLINLDEKILTNDICMIELYHPTGNSFPDHYIDLDENRNIFSIEEDFFEGRFLQISGYPFCKNYFDWEVTHANPIMTHSTSIIRHTAIGGLS